MIRKRKVKWDAGQGPEQHLAVKHSLAMNNVFNPEEFTLGSMYKLTECLSRFVYKSTEVPSPIPVLLHSLGRLIVFMKGTLVMYAGAVRIEMEGEHGIYLKPVHTFIIDGGRYVVMGASTCVGAVR